MPNINTDNLPEIFNYGRYSSDNYGRHTLRLHANGNFYWFSYDTLVAFQINGEFHICKNYWGPTTGKHLNWIDNHTPRETREVFEENYWRLTNNEPREDWDGLNDLDEDEHMSA